MYYIVILYYVHVIEKLATLVTFSNWRAHACGVFVSSGYEFFPKSGHGMGIFRLWFHISVLTYYNNRRAMHQRMVYNNNIWYVQRFRVEDGRAETNILRVFARTLFKYFRKYTLYGRCTQQTAHPRKQQNA